MRVVHILFLDVAFCETISARTFGLRSHELWKFIPRVLLHYAIPMVPKLAYGNTSVPAVSIISGRISRFKSRQRRRQLQFHFPAKGPHTRVLFPRRFRRWRRWYRPRRPIKNVSANRALRIRTQVEMWILTCPFAQREIDANHNDVKVQNSSIWEHYSVLCNFVCNSIIII